mmetsp:Transcript_20552/g.48382  ORF Transcript_20552/g.48382 Transcript_20552/m.48382 type:complete len:235 (+) Transcript_20552:1440-2144(+)
MPVPRRHLPRNPSIVPPGCVDALPTGSRCHLRRLQARRMHRFRQRLRHSARSRCLGTRRRRIPSRALSRRGGSQEHQLLRVLALQQGIAGLHRQVLRPAGSQDRVGGPDHAVRWDAGERRPGGLHGAADERSDERMPREPDPPNGIRRQAHQYGGVMLRVPLLSRRGFRFSTDAHRKRTKPRTMQLMLSTRGPIVSSADSTGSSDPSQSKAVEINQDLGCCGDPGLRRESHGSL